MGLLVAVLGLLVLPVVASAQPGQFSCAIAGATLLNEGQRTTVRDFANAALLDAESDDDAVRQRGIRALMQPFGCSTVTSDFRLEYSRALSDRLSSWARGEDARLAWVAMLLAGRCGTDLVEGVLRDGLRDERSAVRGAAGVGIRDAVASLASGQAGLRVDRANQLLSLAFERLANESDPIVAEQLANIAGALLPNPELQVQHFGAFANGVSGSILLARRDTSEGPEVVVPPPHTGLEDGQTRDRLILLERALDQVRVALVSPRVRDNLRNNDIAAAGLLAGQALAYLRDEIDAGRMSDERIAAAERVIEKAGEVLGTTGGRLGVSRAQADGPRLVAAFRFALDAENSEPFNEVADLWIGAGGGLIGGVFGGRADAYRPVN